ncbi:hypothetical protein [Azospirillum brasilense]|uniref:hypothetical protein n=1 Tax=Azospirillum brasilense TaxID=192 RepID=UPI000E6A4F4A|nr:hypothetical protein [Azospirillum brasilense]NUB26245.1 hypothetical protein [Azospirillum brasilense]NUB34243.1 hypothetical protein [Azospirillum brasilense]RIV99231.1 hypothetical protein D2T81_23845 [Azospirillum brasilense]
MSDKTELLPCPFCGPKADEGSLVVLLEERESDGYVRGTCPVCGSTTFAEAEDRCQIARDLGDDAVCSGGAQDECESPPDGFLYFINPAYVAWIDRQIAEDRL